jgi:hypothetical protein
VRQTGAKASPGEWVYGTFVDRRKYEQAPKKVAQKINKNVHAVYVRRIDYDDHALDGEKNGALTCQ